MSREALLDTFAGTIAGVAQVAVGHPLDTIKVRMQTSGATLRVSDSGPVRLASIVKTYPRPFLFFSTACTFQGCYADLLSASLTRVQLIQLQTTQTTLRREGPRGLYKGAASPLAGAMAQNAACFFSWGLAKKMVAGDGEGELSPSQMVCAGLLAGGACVVVETPIDLLKTQMQVNFALLRAATSLLYRALGLPI